MAIAGALRPALVHIALIDSNPKRRSNEQVLCLSELLYHLLTLLTFLSLTATGLTLKNKVTKI